MTTRRKFFRQMMGVAAAGVVGALAAPAMAKHQRFPQVYDCKPVFLRGDGSWAVASNTVQVPPSKLGEGITIEHTDPANRLEFVDPSAA